MLIIILRCKNDNIIGEFPNQIFKKIRFIRPAEKFVTKDKCKIIEIFDQLMAKIVFIGGWRVKMKFLTSDDVF